MKNVRYVRFVLLTQGQHERTIQRDRDWANDIITEDPWKSSSTFQGFDALYSKIMSVFITDNSLPILLNTGKKTDIQNVNDVPSTADYDKVKLGSETYYIYEKFGRYYVEKPYEFINEITKETYEKIHRLIVSQNLYEGIKNEVSVDVKKYFLQNTLENACILDGDGLIITGGKLADKFVSDTEKGKKASIKIVHKNTDGYTDIAKVIYDGENYYGVKYIPANYYAGTHSCYHKLKFKYIKTFDISNYKFVYLVENNGVTFGDIDKSMISKNFNDWVDSYFLYAISK
ncbi:MAG: DUF5301 domain-containing protein [Clostridium luticellarii]|uniref:DUF5301 domain-containing protein n=1 Tax=Clostridium luticellarii TaxID=1691940 RepID=UPI002355FCF7|nr:DUF5301 domain-containing protein [Clostridium luticellarii]MCI1996658.1 DUF5301 domain-containing protein [Clostridium luticellarii]MCI2039584.1 DUF5301 domain-containing protein [Clostridium luticellarii]